MTTMMGRLEVGEVLRLELGAEGSRSLMDVRDTLDGLHSLLLVTAHIEGLCLQPRLETFPPAHTRDFATGIVDSIPVRRLKMNSPLEVAFTLGTGVSRSTYMANRIFNNIQAARVNFAQASVAVDKAELERELIAIARNNLRIATPAGGNKMMQAVDEASRVLTELSSAGIIPASELP